VGHWVFRSIGCAAAILLAGCAHQAAPVAVDAQPVAAQQVPASVPRPAPAVPAAAAEPSPAAKIVRGTGVFVGAPKKPIASGAANAEEGTTLNFVNADIKIVAKAILGDLLKLNYQIAGNVQGTVTIQTSQPLQRDAILPAFEQALSLNNLALVKSGDTYKITTLDEAEKSSSITPILFGRGESAIGYGVEVVPLKFVNATQMQQLLTPLLPNAGMLQVDATRNLLFVKGTQAERATILDNIALFDVDWLKGMSFALYSPQNIDGRELARELQEVVGGASGPLQGLVRFVPIERLNALLLISTQAQYLDELLKWTQRLDVPGQGSDRRIMIYRVQHGRAADLASVLDKALSLGGASLGGGAGATGPPPGPPTSSGTPDLPITRADAGISLRDLGDANITADDIDNALIILASPKAYETIRSALVQLDTEPLQVLLEAAIAEVTLTDKLRYGVQYASQPNDQSRVVFSSSASEAIAGLLPGLTYTFNNADIKIVLDALSSLTKVEVLSSPQVLVLNNQTATLQVGDQVPIVTEQAVSTITSGAPVVNSVRYQDTGVILKVTPRVNDGGLVMMDISQEVSSVTTTTSSAIDSPTIQQRKINSTVAVQDGETIAIGGLITSNKTRGKQGIPLLQSIPGLGGLFRATNNEDDRTELIVLITPHVIANTERARAVTEELRAKLPAVQRFLRKRR
jgi:general secretion pathway protein D